MEKLSTISFSLLREMKRANDGDLVMLELFELERDSIHGKLVFLNQEVLFIRNREQLDIYSNTYFEFGEKDCQYILFTSTFSSSFYSEVLALLRKYQINYREVNGSIHDFLKFPLPIVKGLVGSFSYKKEIVDTSRLNT